MNDATHAQFAEVRAEMRSLNDATHAQFDHTRAEMRALHEDVIDRIARISEGRKKANGRRKR